MRANKHYGECKESQLLTQYLDLYRDYDLFAILANVRNGLGTAGCETGTGFLPISDNRGLPEDTSDEAGKLGNWNESHSHTWVSLKELLEFDWTRTTVHYGGLSAREFLEWDTVKGRQSAPEVVHYFFPWHTTIKFIPESEMRHYVQNIAGKHGSDKGIAVADLDPTLYTSVSWSETYAKAASQLWERILPIMLNLGRDYGAENVRLVMSFDS
jgi:hypothetical protein